MSDLLYTRCQIYCTFTYVTSVFLWNKLQDKDAIQRPRFQVQSRFNGRSEGGKADPSAREGTEAHKTHRGHQVLVA